eukprot:COSAG03_NODE_16114_length_411_cov_0.996795_1_plen_25_part_10
MGGRWSVSGTCLRDRILESVSLVID